MVRKTGKALCKFSPFTISFLVQQCTKINNNNMGSTKDNVFRWPSKHLELNFLNRVLGKRRLHNLIDFYF